MPSIPIPSLGGFNTVLDSVEMLKRAWSNFSLPAQFTPALSVEELDKRINELKTVEQWLTLNLNMLRGSIQGLELQRGAMNAVGAIGKAMQPEASPEPATATISRSLDHRPPDDEPRAQTSAGEPAAESSAGLPATVTPAAWWSLLQSQFSQIAQTALSAAQPPAASAVKPKAKSAKPVARQSAGKAPAGKKRAAARAPRKPSR